MIAMYKEPRGLHTIAFYIALPIITYTYGTG